MTYSGLYRCSGCSATFADPAAWRQAAVQSPATTGLPHRGAGIGRSDHTGPKPELLATWGAKRDDVPGPGTSGFNEAAQKAGLGSSGTPEPVTSAPLPLSLFQRYCSN